MANKKVKLEINPKNKIEIQAQQDGSVVFSGQFENKQQALDVLRLSWNSVKPPSRSARSGKEK